MRILTLFIALIALPVFAGESCGSYVKDGKTHLIPCDYGEKLPTKRSCHAVIIMVGKKHIFKQVCEEQQQQQRTIQVVEPSGAFKVRMSQYKALVNSLSAEHGIDNALLHAIITVESSYHADAVSEKGAMGLMQLMPATVDALGIEDPYDPQENINGGIQQIKVLLKHYNDDVQLTLAAYNAGIGAVKAYQNTIPPYPETKHYVKTVQTYQQRFSTDWQNHIQDEP
ncbi:lytic transglycosylase domain-containing protein [Suttonella sp. R2A3]|uniref:lytic transglycosylase domain-containing protein n=1 Tax=Suttonella sp. R2A3 TaxID=2908648 RepID=UPI001F2731EB|nr:lytic transglycosylase domain-containing protein [Suttonella sp. R2A3]UJF24707.1 lytic transglycosylase domain-containing protein [Suttonella sp. R2A3]